MRDEQTPKPVPAVQNATMILRLLATRGTAMGATQIAREAGLNVSSAFNILRTLAHDGLLSFDPETKTYRIGMGMMEFATPLLGANPADLIRPLANAIAQDHQVMIALWQITGTRRLVLIDHFTAPRIVQAVIAPNSRLPVFAGAVGRVYAARRGLDEGQTRKGYDGVRWQDPPGFDAYWQDVLAARETGQARDRGQLFRGLDIVAAVACDRADTPRLGLSSITISGQHDDDSLAHVAAALSEAAGQIERGLFCRAAPSLQQT
ncbi:helix-turn-helix domain-containing protein [Paracoccus sp. S1E-3]|uniref:IclR family transcriptional regulator n=1 Tax=Paracoccus sp. S1E-3 TaxID=2756130 RepID=UPI0015EE8FCB|nr:helix-turn-helix domain-containing protein [Paracoccus sp. S1E-3]MBA4490058.1 helix-turn-helix domain-containing protein [Paracoccus sp. S1E-3]